MSSFPVDRCASQRLVPYLICNIVSFLFYLRSSFIRRPYFRSCALRRTRPTFHVDWLTFQPRNLVVAFFLEGGAVSESGRGVSPFCV